MEWNEDFISLWLCFFCGGRLLIKVHVEKKNSMKIFQFFFFCFQLAYAATTAAMCCFFDFINFMCARFGYMEWDEMKKNEKKKVAPAQHSRIILLCQIFLHYCWCCGFVSATRNSIITIKYGLNLWLKLKYHPLRQKNRETIKTTKKSREEEKNRLQQLKIDSHHKIRLKSRTACVSFVRSFILVWSAINAIKSHEIFLTTNTERWRKRL